MVRMAERKRSKAAGDRSPVINHKKHIHNAIKLYYNRAMKNITSYNRIGAALLAVIMMLAVFAGCQTKTSVVNRSADSSRGTAFHAQK